MSLSTREALLLWDQLRPRSLQQSLGMSDLGGCRRRAKYRLEGVEPTDPGGSIQAVLGTLIHEGVAAALKELQERGLIPAEDLVEAEVDFDGVEGHLDHYEADTLTLVDTKSVARWKLDRVRNFGITQEWRYQTANYAASLVKKCYRVRWIRIDVICRDTGEEWSDTRPFSLDEVREAKAWLDAVRATPLEETERDYEPDSVYCQHCPFRTACWGTSEPDERSYSVLYRENPDAREWADELEQARRDKRDAEAREKKARGALLAAKPDGDGRKLRLDVGWDDRVVTFTKVPNGRVNADKVRELCAAAGVEVPVDEGHSIKIGFEKKKEAASS